LKYIFNSLIFFVLFFTCISHSQDKNPTTYPYGGKENPKEIKYWMEKNPILFTKANFIDAKFDSRADFSGAQFDSWANFSGAQFDGWTYFRGAQFDSRADFSGAQFDSWANFSGVQFDSRADFSGVQFDSRANFSGAQFDSLIYFDWPQFDSWADFSEAQFGSWANFSGAQFDSLVYFNGAQFDSWANFSWAQFDGWAYFRGAQFDSLVYFRGAQFDSWADFKKAKFKDNIYFNSSIFNKWIDFRDVTTNYFINFSLAKLKDSIHIGIQNSDTLQKYDFSRAILLTHGKEKIPADTLKGTQEKIFKYPGAKIILYGPVNLKIQLEKFKFISLCDTLSYFAKKDIISTLKLTSFNQDHYKKEQFELDYIFAKSTMHQKELPYYKRYSIVHPMQLWRFLYDITMGLGYRPFRLIFWVLFFITSFTIFYFIHMREKIHGFISKDEKVRVSEKKRKTDPTHSVVQFIYCFYFSAMMFFTIRLKKDVLTFFKSKELLIVVGEWIIGLLIYIAFLTLSKSGSILHNLKSLFIG
jgi:uncharacterized protein YjbI with pentapeptide repeats